MPKRKSLNGLPHNLTKSYFGTLRYYESGYMADWLLNAAKDLRIDTVTLDILNSTIDPKEMEMFPLMYHLKDLKTIIAKELSKNGFDLDFIIDAKIRVEIPKGNIYTKTLYCYPELTDIDGRIYKAGRILETAYEQQFDTFKQRKIFTALFLRAKKLFKLS